MKVFIFGFLKVLKFPVKLLKSLFKKKRKKTELEQKCWKHVRNFAPTHYSWQKSLGRDRKKKRKRGKFSRKKTNNFSKDRNY